MSYVNSWMACSLKQTPENTLVYVCVCVCVCVYIHTYTIQHWPWLSNTIVEITEENAEVQYRLINRLLGWCGVLVGGFFLFIEISIVQGAITGKSPSAGAIVGFATLPWVPLLGWYFWASFKAA